MVMKEKAPKSTFTQQPTEFIHIFEDLTVELRPILQPHNHTLCPPCYLYTFKNSAN